MYADLHVATAAAAMTLITHRLFFGEYFHGSYHLFAFGATLFIYQLSRLLPMLIRGHVHFTRRQKWIKQNPWFVAAINMLALVLMGDGLFHLSTLQLWVLAPAAILSSIYALPIKLSRSYTFRMREVPGFKSFLIAAVWVVACVAVPLVNQPQALFSIGVLHGAGLFVFVLLLAIIVDLHDVRFDKRIGTGTLPILLGTQGTRALVVMLVIIYACLVAAAHHVVFYPVGLVKAVAIAQGITALLAVVMVLRPQFLNRNDLTFLPMVDGVMVLQLLLAVALEKFLL